jgi:four helix bundle protein
MKSNSIIADKSFEFALQAIALYKELQQNNEYIISKQFLRSTTSIGTNVAEASAAQSPKEFIAKLFIASKEARETQYWLNLLEKSKFVNLDYTVYLSSAQELVNILTAIIKTSQNKLNAANEDPLRQPIHNS